MKLQNEQIIDGEIMIATKPIIVYKTCELRDGKLYGGKNKSYWYMENDWSYLRRKRKFSYSGLHSFIIPFNTNTEWYIPSGAKYYKYKRTYVSNKLTFNRILTDNCVLKKIDPNAKINWRKPSLFYLLKKIMYYIWGRKVSRVNYFIKYKIFVNKMKNKIW